MAAVNCVIAIVGGKGTEAAYHFKAGEGVTLRLFPSTKQGGSGKARSLLVSLKHGCIHEVWILTCWIGHSQSTKIASECQKLGIICRRFNGPGEVRRELLSR